MANKSNYPALEAGYGVLNPNYGSLSKNNYDTQEVGFFGLTRKSIENSMGPNASSGMGPMVGVVLRVEGFTNQNGTMDPTSWVSLAGQGLDKNISADGVGLLQLRIRVPEIHACLPVPTDLPESTIEDTNHAIINMYPVYTSRDVRTSQEIPPPGTLVWVDYQNRDTMMGPIFLGAVDNTAIAPPNTNGITGKGAFDAPRRTIYEVNPSTPEAISGQSEVDREFPGSLVIKIAKRLLKDSPIPDDYIVTGQGYPEITAICQTELNFWENGKIREPDFYKEGDQVTERLATYWKNVKGNPITKINDHEPWSAAFISYVLKDADFIGAWSHFKYSKRNENTAFWKTYSLLEDEPEKIKVQLGDVVVKPRKGKSKALSHGDVVWKIENGLAQLVGGNVSKDTSKVIAGMPLNPDGTIQNPGKYVLILKRQSTQIAKN
tara:strand:+ start:1969 stop:3270 length:1302 start_codon:yes stop_codon:yes gene_type:complete